MVLLKIIVISSLLFIHSWYPPSCCSEGDCKAVPCDQITELDNGNLRYENLEYTKDKIHLSQDRYCHVCVGKSTNIEQKLQYNPRCIFIQQNA
jgi:hypothetical protein